MAVNNGVITAPVSVSDARSALGEASTDVGTLCKSAKINKWAKYKPIKLWRLNNTQPRLMLNDTLSSSKQVTAAGTDRTYNRFGLKVPYSADFLPAYTTSGVGALGRMFAYMADYSTYTWYGDYDWVWIPPTGGTTQPYRLTDFNGYNHYAGPINTDFNGAESGDYAAPSFLPKTMVSSITDTSIRVGLAGPTQANSITWWDLTQAVDSTSGEWRMTAEVYSAQTPVTNQGEAGLLGIKNSSGGWATPTIFKASAALTSDMGYNEMTVDVPLSSFTNMVHITIIFGFVKYVNGSPGNAILPPFWPVKRIMVDGNFPFNMRWTGAGYTNTSNKFSGFLSSSSNEVKKGFETGSADLYLMFTVKASSGMSISSDQLSASGFGQYGEKVATSCTFCTQASAGGTFPSNLSSVTLTANTDTTVCIKCEGILQVGEQSTFVVRYTKDGNTTEMATAYVKVTKTS